jgi:predicted transcriptional regulator
MLLTASPEAKAHEVSYAVDATRRKGAETDWTMYELINRKPGLNAYELAKLLEWSTGKAYGSIKRLEKNELVHLERAEKDGKLVLVVRPVEWQDFFTAEELEEFKKMEF